jgi:outer membrane protein OmpA-like peptidoglycan-associated protein
MDDTTHCTTRSQPPDFDRSRRSRKRLLLTGLASLLVAAVSGCDDHNFPDALPATTAAGHSVLVVATATSNEPAPHLPDTVVAELAVLADRWPDAAAVVIGPHGAVHTVALAPRRADGRPEHGARRPALIQQNLQKLQTTLAALASDEHDLDLVDLLGAAVRTRTAIADVVMVSSGVTTAGGIDVRASGWDADPRQVVRFATEHDALPDLAGRRVTFAGLGVVAGVQPALFEPQRRRLESYWLEACRAAGSSGCTVVSGAVAGAASASTARVPVVPVGRVPAFVAPPDAPASRPAQATLPDALFDVDSARLAPGAVDELRGVATTIRSGGFRVGVVGHSDDVPGPTPDYNVNLSRRRAQAVADALVGLGVPRSAIVRVDGVGARENPRGRRNLAPGAQAALRKVVVTAVGS